MNENRAEAPKVTTIRLDPEVRAAVDNYRAKPPRRTFNAAVNALLLEALQAHGEIK